MSAGIFQLGHEAGIKHFEMPQKFCLCCSGLSICTAGPPSARAELPEFRVLLGKVREKVVLPAANTSVTEESQSWWQQGDVPAQRQ